ncbi:Hypothetical protein PBC10988_33000 [Planctomycetales bacterium 10988]|nr:Hypothetical protein PBC10988_33000 [Planctomycetales bacterium 10988]
MSQSEIPKKHPKTMLFFLFPEVPPLEQTSEFGKILEVLENEHEWLGGPPMVFDTEEDFPDMEEFHTYGGNIELYSMLPEDIDQLPKEADRRQFEEISLLIEKLLPFTDKHGCLLDLTLDQDSIGKIEKGSLDETAQTYFKKWKKRIES